MTNGRTHTAATVAVLSAFHLTISQLMKALIEGDDAARWRVRKDMADTLPNDIFENGHRMALLNTNTDHSDIAGIINLNRIALLYMTNKKGEITSRRLFRMSSGGIIASLASMKSRVSKPN